MSIEEAARFEPIIFSNTAENLTSKDLSSGRRNLLKWLGTVVRVELCNGLVLIGILSCTDREGNLVLSNCAIYQDETAEPMSVGNIMVAGKQIKKFSVDMPEQQQLVNQVLGTMIDEILQLVV